MRRAAVAFIFVTVVLDVIAMGVVIPVLPRLVEGFMGGDTANAARMFGAFGTVWSLMQFVCSPLLGALSDRFGRRPVILISNFGLGLDYIFMALAPSLGFLFIGRVISGITGASFTTAGAYIADVTPPEKRAAGYGIMGAAWGLGFVLGPALGGLLGGINPRLPFWVSAALTLLNASYGLFILPESLAPEKRVKAVNFSKANPVGSLRLLRSHHELWGLAGVYAIYMLSHQVLQNVFVLYTSYRYGWNEQMTGLTLAGIGVSGVIVQGLLVKPIVGALGERRSLIVGLICGIAGFLVWGLAPTGHLFWLGIPLGSMMGLFGPSVQGLMTRRVSVSEQGQLSGANTSIMGLTGMVGPIFFTTIFAMSISTHANWGLPGAAFLVGAALLTLSLALAIRVTRRGGEAHA
jgi:DHA1 family tetracycline resistance protein-like MFS transporter